MMGSNKKKFNKKQLEILKGFWQDIITAQNKYCDSIEFIEGQIKHILELDVEVFHVDGVAVGFGDYGRKYQLVQSDKLEG